MSIKTIGPWTSIDAATPDYIDHEEHLILFRGDEVIIWNLETDQMRGAVQKIKDTEYGRFHGDPPPTHFDAAFYRESLGGSIYLFYGEYACQLDLQNRNIQAWDYPAASMIGLQDISVKDLDAAIQIRTEHRTFNCFFKGAEFWKSYEGSDGGVGTPTLYKISDEWPGLFEGGVDAAATWKNRKIYFFKGEKFISWDVERWAIDPGFPKKISTDWLGFDPAKYVVNTPHGSKEFGSGFSRLFPKLEALDLNKSVLKAAGRLGGPFNGPANDSSLPLGFVFLGQFIDHDITLDVTSALDHKNTPEAIQNMRTPRLDLDCVYRTGPEASRDLYYQSPNRAGDPSDIAVFRDLIKTRSTLYLNESENDLPRNHNGVALIGDPRNDDNRFVSQLHLLIMQFHNQVVDALLQDCVGSIYKPEHPVADRQSEFVNVSESEAREKLFEEARNLTRWHFQWIVVHEFLPQIVGQELVDDIRNNGRKIFNVPQNAQMPVEFSVAAYRFGHTMIPDQIQYNSSSGTKSIFDPIYGRGFDPSPTGLGAINWDLFFGPSSQKSGGVDTRLADSLLELPFIAANDERSLAARNLLRSQSFGLPSGQSVADEIDKICGTKIERPDLTKTSLIEAFGTETPLWAYILAEGLLSDHDRLGPVGGRIVAEVLIGLLDADETSFLNAGAGATGTFKPSLVASQTSVWNMSTLIAFALKGRYT
jgi:hypothetical protein